MERGTQGNATEGEHHRHKDTARHRQRCDSGHSNDALDWTTRPVPDYAALEGGGGGGARKLGSWTSRIGNTFSVRRRKQRDIGREMLNKAPRLRDACGNI